MCVCVCCLAKIIKKYKNTSLSEDSDVRSVSSLNINQNDDSELNKSDKELKLKATEDNYALLVSFDHTKKY